MVSNATEIPSPVQADVKKTRQRSPFLFPAYSFGTGLDVAKRIEDGGAGVWSEETLAVNMGLSMKSSGFRLKCLTARQFGLVAKQGDNLVTTPLAKAILKPTSEGEGPNNLRQAFLKMPLFQAVAERYKGQPLPQKDTFLNVLEREFGIEHARVKDAERMLRDSAREAGVLTISGDKEYLAMPSLPPLSSGKNVDAIKPSSDPSGGVDADLADVRKKYAEYLLDKVKDSQEALTDDLMDRLERVLGITRTQPTE
jgi:hypothetical protein